MGKPLGRKQSWIRCVRSVRHYQTLKEIQKADGIDAIRGHEGMAAKAYFASLPCLISSDVPPKLVPQNRNRRPPQDPFNALLSFGYSLLYRSVLEGILVVGLEPAFGFLHQPRSATYPLVLDMMELFRVPVWDMAVIASINRHQWDPERDFMVSPGRVWLNDSLFWIISILSAGAAALRSVLPDKTPSGPDPVLRKIVLSHRINH